VRLCLPFLAQSIYYYFKKLFMKSVIKISVLIIALSSIFISCKKFEDGPLISLRTKKARISHNWAIEKVTVNGEDKTSDYQTLLGPNYELDIEKGGKYHTSGLVTDEGTWEFGEDKDDIRFDSDQPGTQEQSFHILRLTSKEFWAKQTDIFANVTEIHYKAK
jgi:hypothetical protein